MHLARVVAVRTKRQPPSSVLYDGPRQTWNASALFGELAWVRAKAKVRAKVRVRVRVRSAHWTQSAFEHVSRIPHRLLLHVLVSLSRAKHRRRWCAPAVCCPCSTASARTPRCCRCALSWRRSRRRCDRRFSVSPHNQLPPARSSSTADALETSVVYATVHTTVGIVGIVAHPLSRVRVW